MTGDWIARVAKRLIHASTFTLVVSPAIADLQFEEESSQRPRSTGYLAVWVALAGALWLDLAYDKRRPVWADDVSGVARLIFLMTSYHLSMFTLVLGFDSGGRAFIGPLFAAIVGPWSLTMCAVLLGAVTTFMATRAHHDDHGDRAGLIDG